MHVSTRLALAIPLYEIGGVKNLFDCFPVLLEWCLHELCVDYDEDLVYQIKDYFDPKLNTHYFCKTNNRSVMTHIKQFKTIIEYNSHACEVIDQQVCDKSIKYWYKNLITNPYNTKEYTRPGELWMSFIHNDTLQ